MKTATGKILNPQMIDLAIKSEFAQYASDIEACFTGSDRDALHKICLALEHYALDVGLADHRVKVGIEGLRILILREANKAHRATYQIECGDTEYRLSVRARFLTIATRYVEVIR